MARYVYVITVDGYHSDEVMGKYWDFCKVIGVFKKMTQAREFLDKQIEKLKESASGEKDEFRIPIVHETDVYYEAIVFSKVVREDGMYIDSYKHDFEIIRHKLI